MDYEALFAQFLKERVYLKNITPKTKIWYQNEHHIDRLKINLLKEEKKVIKAFTEAQLRMGVNYKAKD